MKDFEEAIERVIAGLEKKSRVMNKQERERVAYLGAILPEGPDAVNRITTRIVDMRDEITTELAEGLAALAAGKNPA